MDNTQENAANSELMDLGTHAAAATNLHKTRTTEQPVTIQPPASPAPGAIDMRSDRYKIHRQETENNETP